MLRQNNIGTGRMTSENTDTLKDEIADLRAEIARINAHKFIRAHDSYLGLIGFNFLRGLALGLGTVVGATILVSVAVYFLSQIDFIPIVGDWAREIADDIASSRTPAN